MIIKPSSYLRNDYNSLSSMARETAKPIYITKNGEGDMVLMSIEAFEQREQLLALEANVAAAERSRRAGGKAYSLGEIRAMLNVKHTEEGSDV